LSNTASFPNVQEKTDIFHNDGYIISDDNKLLIDSCLNDFPDMLFMEDLPEELDSMAFENQYVFEGDRKSALYYASQTCGCVGHGWGIRCIFKSLTSVMAYLIEQGAGIGYKDVLSTFDLTRIPPQLFVGASDKFIRYTAGSKLHVYKFSDIINLYRSQSLSDVDIKRLSNQAMNGLRYGNFNADIKQELININRVLAMIKSGLMKELMNLFSDKQLLAYVKHGTELQITFLQALDQLAQTSFPQEIIHIILSYLTGLNISEVSDMGKKIIEKHVQEFPAFQMRR